MQHQLLKNSIAFIALACVVSGSIFFISLLGKREVVIGPIETIHAIAYPFFDNKIRVSEQLAHADVFLHSPALGKRIKITVTFDPNNADYIHLGVREGVFWLGYDKKELFNTNTDPLTTQTKTLDFALSNSFQDVDQSADIMFFTDSPSVTWSIEDIHATVYFVWPTVQEVKGYVKSIWNKEREI